MSSNDGGKGKEPLKPSYREKVEKGSSYNSKSWADEMEKLDNDVAEVDLNESAITDHCEDWEKKIRVGDRSTLSESAEARSLCLIGKVLGGFAQIAHRENASSLETSRHERRSSDHGHGRRLLSVQICKR
ncbi:hypothetical protein H6P81_021188 [Aristolochia fimbriata]|uniref:Uncharacterized protein n=1 Tax=Aristolochia fimbriata TaxID=158543 RepID=A0AAV7DQN0_ARIFI|nr:hypothetical protein H6P81_021188 [Aristolochia fimbriata]